MGFTGDQCLCPIATCDTNQGIAGLGGECRPVWWAWLIIGLVALFIIGGFLCCCICCCCSAILDCLSAAAGGTRATPLLELAKPSFPPSRLSGRHLNIVKIFGTPPRI